MTLRIGSCVLPMMGSLVLSAACVAVPPDVLDDAPTDAPPEEPVAEDDLPELNVVELSGLDGYPACAQPADLCTEDYLRFADLAAEWARPIDEGELNELITDRQTGLRFEDRPTSGTELREIIRDALNVGFLQDRGDASELRVREHFPPDEDRRWLGPFPLQTFEFSDPLVGTFEVVLALPDGPGPFPGIVMHPGHFEGAYAHLQNYYGVELLEAGFALLTITPRAYDGWTQEDRVTRSLLRNGFTFVGLRAYELLLARKYLRFREDVGRVGLLGHSGGSATGNVLAWMEPGFEAYASDLITTYTGWNEDGLIMDETAPHLAPWANHVANLPDAPVPTLQGDYGYPQGPDPLIRFFTEHLAGQE